MQTQLQRIDSVLKVVWIVNHRNKFLFFQTSTSKQCDENFFQIKLDIEEFLAKQEILNDVSRKDLLDNVFQPEEGFTFPTKWLHGCFRSFNFKLWTKRYPFLVYNRSMDSVFCLSCVLFATSSTFLFNKLPGFSNQHKTGEKTEEHNNTSTHKESMSKLEDFEARFSNPDLTIPFSFDKERQKTIENNTEI